MSQGSYRCQQATGVAVRQRQRDRPSRRKDEPAVGPAHVSIGSAMANRHSSRCDCRRCIETEEAAQSLRQTASRCGVPASPSGGIFRCRPGSTAAAARGGRPARTRPLVERSPEAASLRVRSSQDRNIAKTFRPTDFYQICAQATGIIPRRNQPQHPSHPRSPSRLSTRPIVRPVSSYPRSLDTPSVTPGV